MTSQTFQCVIGLTALLGVTVGCESNSRDEKPATPVAGDSATRNPVGKTPTQLSSSSSAPSEFTGTVIETMDSGGYTYVQVDTGTKTIWAAATEFEVKVGELVVVPAGMPMPDFHSNTLNRDFELIYFTSGIRKAGAATSPSLTPGQLPSGHPPLPGGGQQAQALPSGHPPLPGGGGALATQQPHSRTAAAGGMTIEPGSIEKPSGGVTVAEIVAGKDGLAGKEVVVRGKVVKYTGGILKRNWLHLMDGTGDAGANDLTVTTADSAALGDTVLVRGRVVVDKDFGAGYRYDVLVEDASVTVEK